MAHRSDRTRSANLGVHALKHPVDVRDGLLESRDRALGKPASSLLGAGALGGSAPTMRSPMAAMRSLNSTSA